MPLCGIPYSLPRTCARAGRQRRDSEGEMQKCPFHSRKGRLLDFVTLRAYADLHQPLNLDYSGFCRL